MMKRLLGLAVKRDIEKNFAQSLAKKRLQANFSDNGEPIPLLKFAFMDAFEMSVAGNTLFKSDGLSRYQRELLGLVVTAKGQQVPQEKIQLELWPENPPDKARKSFDTLLSRLRKKLSPQLPLTVKKYLYIQKGIVCLRTPTSIYRSLPR